MSSKGKYNAPEWIGKKYYKFEVIEPVHVKNGNHTTQWFWKVKCDCGEERIVNPISVLKGHYKSCGCSWKDFVPHNKSHNESHTRLHNIWCGINNRCNPNHVNSGRYGKRGIKICDEWRDYEKFALWARNSGYQDDMTIERIDVNKDYCPENCTWIPFKQQARNRTTTHWVEYMGETMSLAEACEKAKLPYKQVFERIVKRKWPVDIALSKPIGSGRIFNSKHQYIDTKSY